MEISSPAERLLASRGKNSALWGKLISETQFNVLFLITGMNMQLRRDYAGYTFRTMWLHCIPLESAISLYFEFLVMSY
jgi:hypothetical protein